MKTMRRRNEKGSVFVIFALSLLGFMGLAALAIDLGAVYSAKAELQAGADAAALAAIGEIDSGATQTVAAEYAAMNTVMRKPITLAQSDVITGQFDFQTGEFAAGVAPANAVKVKARRTPNSPDGPLELFFGKAIGCGSVAVEAESVAAFDNRVAGVTPAGGVGQFDLLPFAVDIKDIGHVEEIARDNSVTFTVGAGGISVQDKVDIRVRVLGKQITYGTDGPDIPVYAWASVDGGTSFEPINGGTAVVGGEETTYTGVTNAAFALKGQAKYVVDGAVRFDSTRNSADDTPYVYVLKNGDSLPATATYNTQTPVEVFLEPYIDSTTGRISIGANDVIFLMEFSNDLTSAAADFQDLAVLCTFTKVVDEELPASEKRFVADIGKTIDFYPYIDSAAPGNFGLVSLDGYSNGASTITEWIRNGYPGTFEIPSDPGYIEMNGCPGMVTSIKSDVETRIGDTVLVVVYDQLTDNGNNATYRVPYFAAMRIESQHLTGEPSRRHLTGTLVGLHTSNLLTKPGAPEHKALSMSRMAK